MSAREPKQPKLPSLAGLSSAPVTKPSLIPLLQEDAWEVILKFVDEMACGCEGHVAFCKALETANDESVRGAVPHCSDPAFWENACAIRDFVFDVATDPEYAPFGTDVSELDRWQRQYHMLCRINSSTANDVPTANGALRVDGPELVANLRTLGSDAAVRDKLAEGCTDLTITQLPSTVTAIGWSAFYGCTKLALTSLPSGVTSIEGDAFSGCTSLALTALPDATKTLKPWAFANCTNMPLVSLPPDLPAIGRHAFYNCQKLNLSALPKNLTVIERCAFEKCNNWSALEHLPVKLETILEKAFCGCAKLALTTLPNTVKSIDRKAFYGCAKLALTSLPEQLMYIDRKAFYGCVNLELTSLPEQLVEVDECAFEGCSDNVRRLATAWREAHPNPNESKKPCGEPDDSDVDSD